VAASGSSQGAMVLSPHSRHTQYASTYYWEPKSRAFVSRMGRGGHSTSINQFPNLIKKLATIMGTEIQYYLDEEVVSFSRLNASPLTFDLASTENELLFAEVLFLVNMLDELPPFLSFHFESLKGIAAKFGTESEEYDLAVHMVDAIISHLNSEYQQRYNFQMAIIYSPKRSDRPSNVVDGVTGHFSMLSQEIGLVSEDIERTLASGVDLESYIKRSAQQVPQPAPQPPPGPVIADQAEISLVHIVLWLILGLVCALLQACYHLAVIDGSNEPEFKPKTYEGGMRSKTTKM